MPLPELEMIFKKAAETPKLFLEIFLGLGITAMNHLDGLALVHFGAQSAVIKAFFSGTLSDGAKVTAKIELHSVATATGTVDGLRRDFGSIVHLRPLLGGSLPKFIVIILCGDIGVALFTVEPTTGNHFTASHKNYFSKVS